MTAGQQAVIVTLATFACICLSLSALLGVYLLARIAEALDRLAPEDLPRGE